MVLQTRAAGATRSRADAMKVCREHGIRVTPALKPSRATRMGVPGPDLVPVGYLCPFSPSRVLREDEVIDPDA